MIGAGAKRIPYKPTLPTSDITKPPTLSRVSLI